MGSGAGPEPDADVPLEQSTLCSGAVPIHGNTKHISPRKEATFPELMGYSLAIGSNLNKTQTLAELGSVCVNR